MPIGTGDRRNGTLDTYNLISDNVKLDVEQNGHVYTRVENTLDVNILSNGTVYYKGFPSITSDISFQGTLVDEN